ncbi:hypothetical protein [Mariniluteicoccus flavus]
MGIGGGLLAGVAGAFIGTSIAHSMGDMFDGDGNGFGDNNDFGGDQAMDQGGMDQGGEQGFADQGGDFGGGDFGGGDFGGGDFGGGDFGCGDFGGDLGGDF